MDIYLSFEYMESDLHNVIKRGSILKDIHKRYVMYQLFNATNYIHSGNVIHRDMKPSNVLVDSKCRLVAKCIYMIPIPRYAISSMFNLNFLGMFVGAFFYTNMFEKCYQIEKQIKLRTP